MILAWSRHLEERLSPRIVFVLVLLALLAIHARALRDPPYWDALIGSFPQGLWLARHDFDLVRLVTQEKTCQQGGPNVYPFSLYPLLIGVLYAWRLVPGVVFLTMHLVSLALAATCAAVLFALARRRLEAPLGMLVTLLFVSAPLFQSLAAQMDMDMPLCACTLLSLRSLDRQRFPAAWSWSLLALAIQPRGVIVVVANLAALVLCAAWPRVAQCARRENPAAAPRTALLWALAHLGLVALFGLELFLLARFSGTPAHVGLLGGFAGLWERFLWIVPEYGVALHAALVFVLLAAVRAWRSRASWHELHLALFVLVFIGFYGQYTNTLARYFLQSYPHVLLLVLGGLPRGARATAWTAGLLALASLVQGLNHAGVLYPPVPSGWSVPGYADADLRSNDGHLLERSMEYRDDLALNLEIARYLERFERERTVVVANWPLPHALAVPEFGYVDRPWRTSSQAPPLTFDPLAVPYRELYDTSARPIRKRMDVDAVWVMVPNVYVLPNLALQPRLDVVTKVLERGAHRAFIVRRVGWEGR